ncbi:nuclear transport factor 2 family protein [Dongia sp.]|uniref:nuclear transport factor 2 family protein n=1 Tax=Dongia sp. TaxID=1977262 RepID=UPI0035B4F80D
MQRLWAVRLAVSCIHPGAVPLLSRTDVLDSWRQIFGNGQRTDISFLPQQMAVVGGIGIACGLELIGNGQIACTNLFAEEDGEWRMFHHQGGPVILRQPGRSTESGNITRH